MSISLVSREKINSQGKIKGLIRILKCFSVEVLPALAFSQDHIQALTRGRDIPRFGERIPNLFVPEIASSDN